YIVVRVLAEIASTNYAGGDGYSTWYLGNALDVVLFLRLGWVWWPLPIVLTLGRALLLPAGLHAGLPLNFLSATPETLIYALATRYAVKTLHLNFPLRTLRDVGYFAAIFCGLAPLLGNAVSIAAYALGGFFAWSQFAEQFARGVAADASAIIVVVPAAMQLLDHREDEREERLFDDRHETDLSLGLAATFLVVVLEYTLGTRFGRPLVELSFVPLAWLAIRSGLRGAVFGILVADVSATLMHVILNVPVGAQIEYEGYLVASALMALLLGAVTGDRDRLLRRMERGANVDELTNLPNRERLLAWIKRHREQSLVLVILDVDDMRLLNEGIGRLATDRVLIEFAARLRTGLPPSYFVARLSSDEFAIAIVDDRSPHAVIAEIRQLLEVPFDIEGSRIFIEASAGAVRMARAGEPDDVLRRADLALHRAKNSPSRAIVYTPDLQGTSVPLLVVELHRALEQGEFVPFFQPIYRFLAAEDRWQLVGAEALLRWVHPERGVVAPAEFIDMLERLAIGNRVGWNVMESSLRLANRWRLSVPDFRVWVNLFGRQVLDGYCVTRIRETIEAANSVPEALVVEINEKVVVSEERDVSALALQLRAMGIITAIDDFGTGGSSLGRVREVPAQVLKIDRSFVTRCEIDAKAKAVASAVVRLAGELGMSVVAEGVENGLQVETMLAIGCEYAQGYALGHPIPAELFERMVLESVAS
ncbi:MAG TPA: EAL domain-containing protein, partial [Verrucomicrobiae bacterium]|nr:EAL domain-containing protein [Verrucomicrobiae bacterium]